MIKHLVKLFRKSESADEIRARLEGLASAWRDFYRSHPKRESLYLDQLMIEFRPKANALIEERFPFNHRRTAVRTSVLVEIAVELSGTHTAEEVRTASAEIIFGTRKAIQSADNLMLLAEQIRSLD